MDKKLAGTCNSCGERKLRKGTFVYCPHCYITELQEELAEAKEDIEALANKADKNAPEWVTTYDPDVSQDSNYNVMDLHAAFGAGMAKANKRADEIEALKTNLQFRSLITYLKNSELSIYGLWLPMKIFGMKVSEAKEFRDNCKVCCHPDGISLCEPTKLESEKK